MDIEGNSIWLDVTIMDGRPAAHLREALANRAGANALSIQTVDRVLDA